VEWFVRGDETKRLWPQRPNPDTHAHDVLNRSAVEGSGVVLASAWFDHPIAASYQIHEHSIRVYSGLVLSLLWWQDETMLMKLDDFEEERDARRSDSWRR
jgi:hypothetical protein